MVRLLLICVDLKLGDVRQLCFSFPWPDCVVKRLPLSGLSLEQSLCASVRQVFKT